MAESPRSGRRFWEGLALGALAGEFARELDLPGLVSFWGDPQYVILGAALLGGVLALTRLRALVAIGTAGLGVLWLAACFTPLTAWLARGLVRSDPLQPADAVFVLGSRLQRDNDPGAGAASRLWRALELLAQDRAPRLILSEQPPPAGRYEPIARAWMASLGVERELLTVGPITNTRGEAVAVAALCRARGFERLLLVTSPMHTRRACAAFEREGLSVVCVPAVETEFDLDRLEYPGDRVKAFGVAMHERLGLWVYRRRGWIR